MKNSNRKGIKFAAACVAAVMALSMVGGSAATTKKSKQVSITVFAAASLTESFGELAKDLLKSERASAQMNYYIIVGV